MYQFSQAPFIKEPVLSDQQPETQSVPQTLVFRWLGECATCLAAMEQSESSGRWPRIYSVTEKHTNTYFFFFFFFKVVTRSRVVLYFSQHDIWS